MKLNFKLMSILLVTTLAMSSCSALGVTSKPESTPIPTVEGSSSVISQGNVMPKDYAYLAFPTGGHVSQVLVKKGDQVTSGQVLASLGDREQYQANVTAAALEVENAQQSLDALNKSSSMASNHAWLALLNAKQQLIQAEETWAGVDTKAYQQQIDNANIKISDMKTALDDAQTEYDKYINLDASNPTRKTAGDDLNSAQQDYDNAVHARDQLLIAKDLAQANLQLAQAMLTQAQSDYDATRQGVDPEKLKIAQMNLDIAQAHLSAAKSALDNLDLKAPFRGTVVDVNISIGELASPSSWAILIADFSEWYVETSDLTEQKVVNISIGQGASISPDALSGLDMHARVTEISTVSHLQAGDVLYTARLLLDQPDPRLRWGMTVEITFDP